MVFGGNCHRKGVKETEDTDIYIWQEGVYKQKYQDQHTVEIVYFNFLKIYTCICLFEIPSPIRIYIVRVSNSNVPIYKLT